jgi:hypothetical protein
MAKSLLEIWLDLTLGEVVPELGDQLDGSRATYFAAASADADHGCFHDALNFSPVQDTLCEKGIQERKDHGTADNG